MNRFLFALLGLSLAGAVSAEVVAESDDAVTFRQPDRQEVTISKLPRRTVICYASLADIWYASGGAAVGVPKVRSLDVLPEAARELPTIGSVSAPNPEQVLALEPDLVLLNGRHERHRALAELLRSNGIEAVCVEYNNYTDFAELAEFFARLNDAGGESPAGRTAREVAALCAIPRDRPGPKLAIVFAAAAGFALETPDSNTGAIAAMLGARNIVSAAGAPRIDFSYEQLLLDDPEVILLVTMGDVQALQDKLRRELMEQPAWQELAAARAGRVHFLPADLFLFQAGSRYPEAFRYLAGLLYPGGEPAP